MCKWKHGETIRERETGRPFLVLHVFKNIATMLVDLTTPYSAAIVLLPKDYEKFALDLEMKQTVDRDLCGNIIDKWNYDTYTP